METKRVVVIDDSEVVLAMVSDILGDAGYEVMTSDSGIYANEYIYSTRKPDLILVDVMMPLLQGDKKVRLIKQREKSRNIPILLMSSKTTEELEALVETSGADGFIQKPFTPASLVNQVRAAVAN